MADSFFGFNTSLSGLELVEEPELDEEEEYDALNDETFGTDAFQGDWEEDHSRFAKADENSKTYRNSFSSEKDDDLYLDLDWESLSHLVLENEKEDLGEGDKGHVRHKASNAINQPNRYPYDSVHDFNFSSPWSFHSDEKSSKLKSQSTHSSISKSLATQFLPPQLSKIQTVQELESDFKHVPKDKSHILQSKSSSTEFSIPPLPKIPTVQQLEQDLIHRNKDGKNVKKENLYRESNQSFNWDKSQSNTLNLDAQSLDARSQFQSSGTQSQNPLSEFPPPPGSNKFPPGLGPFEQGHFNQLQQEMAKLRSNQNTPIQSGSLVLPQQQVPVKVFPYPPYSFHLPQNPRMGTPHRMPLLTFMPPHPMKFMTVVPPHPPGFRRLMRPHPLIMHQPQLQQHHQKQNKSQYNYDHSINGQASRNQHQFLPNGNNSNYPHYTWLTNHNWKGNANYDEYAGLMNNRERQWLINIQIIQLATDKPHVDDYYYSVWSKKQQKEKMNEKKRKSVKNEKPNREPFFPNNKHPKNELNHRERKDSERDVTFTPSPKVYVPLQFENSLGKLQCGSVTAPRKIIDLDVVPELQVHTSPSTNHRDSRKTKKILLELEKLYLLIMQVEEIDNEVVAAASLTSDEPPPSKSNLLEQIMNSYLNEDRFVNFMCIRKGKTLLLRVFRFLNRFDHREHLTTLWCRLFKSMSIIIRRDQNDGLLIQLHPFFKQWINTVNFTILSTLTSHLLTANIQNQTKKTSRAASPNFTKSFLSSILLTAFGVSIVSNLLARGEELYPSLQEKEQEEWTDFILNFIKQLINCPNIENIPTPLEPLPGNVITVILNRSTGLHIQDYASARRVLTAFNQEKSRS